jgi:hypothetical protein
MFVFRGVQNTEVLSGAARDRLHGGAENKCNPRSLRRPGKQMSIHTLSQSTQLGRAAARAPRAAEELGFPGKAAFVLRRGEQI